MDLNGMGFPRPLLEGALRRLGFPDLLQSLSHGEPCQVLFLTGDQVKGFIWLSGRLVIRVRTIKRRDEEAFCELFNDGHQGGFRVYPLPPSKIPDGETVGELETLLIRAAWVQDERGRMQRATAKPGDSFCNDTSPTLKFRAIYDDTCPTMPTSVREIIEALEERSTDRDRIDTTRPNGHHLDFVVRGANGDRGRS